MGVRGVMPRCVKRPDLACAKSAHGLHAVIATRRPGRDSASAGAELVGARASGWLSLTRPPELGPIDPDTMQNDGDLASDCNAGFSHADPFDQAHTPSLQG